MLHWTNYYNHVKNTYQNSKKTVTYDDTVYTFDIETTTVVNDNGVIYNSDYYDTLSEEDKINTEVYGFMYIWMFSINDVVYYGRTWDEFRVFIDLVFDDPDIMSTVYVHNLAYEMQFLRCALNINDVFARQKYKPIYCNYRNVQFRCSLYLTASKLEDLPKFYGLKTNKLTGNLDYTKIRHYDTVLTQQEMDYCENDCLVLYELIKHFMSEYGHIKNIPYTKTSIIRRKTRNSMKKSTNFQCKMRDIANNDGEFYNALTLAFQGGYVHANFYKANKVLYNVESYDICSSYPFVMAAEDVFPIQKFEKDNIPSTKYMKEDRIYILHLRFKNLMVKKQNTTISLCKCYYTSESHALDNGRVLYCESTEMYCTNYDFESIGWFYEWDDVEVIESWSAPRGYLPKDFIKFILKIYEEKTLLKGTGRDVEYQRSKSDFNSLYGMSVTNNIKDEVEFLNNEWDIIRLTDEMIQEKLNKEFEHPFLNFAYGVFVTSKARYNLLRAVAQLDEYNAYSDTDSLKLCEGFDRRVINRYNLDVISKIKKAKKKMSISGYSCKDIKGISHTLGLLEYEATYDEFKTLGAKKYCYLENGDIHITVSGVPKRGSKCLNSVDDFTDDLVFEASVTGKNQCVYNEKDSVDLTITDYNNVTRDVHFGYGVGLVPCSYTLASSSFYVPFNDSFIHRRLINGKR